MVLVFQASLMDKYSFLIKEQDVQWKSEWNILGLHFTVITNLLDIVVIFKLVSI